MPTIVSPMAQLKVGRASISLIICPITVIHGEQDWVVPIAHAHHTANIVRNSELKTFPQHGHLSIGSELISALKELRDKS